MAESFSEFAQRADRERQQQNVGKAQVVLGTVEDKPDQVAGDLRLATDYSRATGAPVPPAPVVKEYRNIFQQKIEERKTQTILSQAPRLTEFLQDPTNAALVRDALPELSWWETSGNAVERGAMRVPQAYNQFMAQGSNQRAADIPKTFSEMLSEETTVKDAAGNTVYERPFPSPFDLYAAGSRYITSRGSSALGIDEKENARLFQQQAGRIAKEVGAMPMSPAASRFRDATLGDDKRAVADRMKSYNEAMFNWDGRGEAPAKPEEVGGWEQGWLDTQKFMSGIAADPKGAIAFLTETAVESLPMIAASIGVGAVTRSPAAAATFMGATSGLQEAGMEPVEFFRSKGIDVSTPEGASAVISNPALMKEAADRGLMRGTIIGVLDGLSGGIAGKTLAKSQMGNFAVQALVQAAMGGGGEGLAQLATDGKVDMRQVLVEAFAEFVTSPIEVAGIGFAKFREMQGKAAAATEQAAKVGEVSQAAQSSVVRERSPDTFRQFVDNATAGQSNENIYVNADKFVEFFQGMGLDPFALMDEIDGMSRADLDAALESGDLKIPTASYAAKLAGSEYDQFFMENGRFDPDSMSMTEAQEFELTKNELMDEAWQEAEAARAEEDAMRPVEAQIQDELVSRLRTEGRGTDEAQTIAKVITDHYRVTAAEQGITTSEYLARYPLPQFRGAVPQGMQLRDVDAVTRTLTEARNRRAAPRKSGPSLLEFISDYGGIANDRGELRARDAEVVKRGKGKKTLRLRRSSMKDGMRSLLGQDSGKRFGADDVALAAIESGFMADHPVVREYVAAMEQGREVPDITVALWDEIDNELRDGPRASADLNERADRNDELDKIEDYLDSIGVSLDDDDATIRAAMNADQESEGRKYGQYLFQDATQGPRGSISIPTAGIGKGEAIIRTFETANLSTILHELGHLFLIMTQADAVRGVPTAVEKMDAVKTWWRSNAGDVAKDAMRVMPDVTVTAADVEAAIDNGTTGDLMKDAAIDVGMQEQTARGFEAYLFEGKAPSAGMRDVFARMSAWLVRVYRKIAALDVKLDPNIRAVFDRMLATETEIEAAQRDLSADHPLFANAEEMGLTQEQYEKLMRLRRDAESQAKTKLLAKVMEPERRKQEAWFKEERAKVRGEIEREMKASRTYRAIQEIRFGKDFDGADVPAMKLSREAIERDFGAGYLPYLPGTTKDGKGHKNAVFTNEGGVHPDVVAGSYGFNSGAELLDAMTQTPPLNEAIEAETEKTMRERHGDVLNDGTIEAEALDAVHNDKRGEWIAADLKAVVDVAGTDTGLTYKEARAAAKLAAGRMTVRDATNVHRFLTAERKAGADAARLGAMLARDKVWLDAARRKIGTTARAAVRGEASPNAVAGAIDDFNARFDTTSTTYQVEEQQRVSPKGNAYTIPGGERTSTSLGYNDLVAKLIAAKRRQLMNHALYMEANRIVEDVDKSLTKIGRLNRINAKQAKTRNIDHVMAARAIAGKFGLARPDTQFDFDAWIIQLQNDDPGMAAAMGQAITTYANNPVQYRNLTVDEFGAIRDAIDNILETGKRYRKLEIEGQTVDRDAAVEELIAVLETRGLKSNEAMKARLTDAQKNGRSATSMLAALRRMENWARDMDDGEQGVFTRYLVRPVMNAVDTYRGEKAGRLRQLLDIINPRKDELLGGSITAPELGYTFQNKGELLHAILHTGNESNKEKLLIGRGWSDGLSGQQQAVTAKGKPRVDRAGNPIMTRGTVDTSKWDAFIARMAAEGKVTKEDFDTAQAIWDLMEEMKRPAQSAHRKMFGYYFDEVEASTVQTPFGEYKGGYVPAIADTDASNDGQIRADQQAMEAQQTSYMFPTTGKGFTKARVQNYRTPLALNLMLLPAHMDKVLRFTHLEPTIRQTASLVSQRDMREALDGFDRSITPNLITPWLQRTAQQAVETQPSTPAGRAFSTAVRVLRTRVGVHTMFANLVNTVQQVTGFASAAVLVKPANLKKSLIEFTRDRQDMRGFASEKSAFMRDRIENVGRETQKRIQEAIVEPTTMGGIRDFVSRHGYFMQSATQNVVDVIAWHAAYDQSIGKGMSDADAAFEADSIIRRTMGDFSPENLSMFETGSAFQRLFTMFYSYFNGQANLVGGEMQTVMRTMGWNGAPRMFFIYLFGLAIPAIVGEMIVQAAKGELLDDDDDDGYLDEIAELFFGSQAKYIAGMVPVAGQLSTAAMNKFNDQFYDDRINPSPVISTAERVVGAPFSVGSAVFGDGSSSKAVSDAIVSLGLVTGIPTGQLAKSAGYLTGIAEGKSSPEGVGDVVRGVVSGRDGSEK